MLAAIATLIAGFAFFLTLLIHMIVPVTGNVTPKRTIKAITFEGHPKMLPVCTGLNVDLNPATQVPVFV